MHVEVEQRFLHQREYRIRRTLVSKPRWWYQKNHPNIIGGSLVDGMTPLSCLYHDYLHRYGRREVDVMVAFLIFATRTAMDLVAGGMKTVQGTQNENITHTCTRFQLNGTKK